MSWKDDFIKRYGKAMYNRRLKRAQTWWKKHPENSRKWGRKGGELYEKYQIYKQTGLQGERNKIRSKHGYKWRPYKHIIAPNSQIHHQWLPGTAGYTGVALVEKDQHIHGFIKVIQILEGEITLFCEANVLARNEVELLWTT